jgi:hypothetical protein
MNTFQQPNLCHPVVPQIGKIWQDMTGLQRLILCRNVLPSKQEAKKFVVFDNFSISRLPNINGCEVTPLRSAGPSKKFIVNATLATQS